MPSEFDAYAQSYKDIINRGAAITGESFEYFIGVRVALVIAELGGSSAQSRTQRILDFGCGIGATEQVFRQNFPGATLHGIDESPESLKAAEALGVPGATFHLAESTRLPFEDASFDLIYSNGTMHHIDHAKHAAVLGDLARVLRPGGNLFIFENNPLNPVMVRAMRQNPFDANARMLFPWYLRQAISNTGIWARRPRYYAFYPKHLKAIRWTERYLERLPLGAQYYVRGTKP
jgi:SAM-dependent methyltransferase